MLLFKTYQELELKIRPGSLNITHVENVTIHVQNKNYKDTLGKVLQW